MIVEFSQPAMFFAAGYLAAAADQRFGLKNEWWMRVYMDHLKASTMSIDYLYRLERAIARAWPASEIPPRLVDVVH